MRHALGRTPTYLAIPSRRGKHRKTRPKASKSLLRRPLLGLARLLQLLRQSPALLLPCQLRIPSLLLPLLLIHQGLGAVEKQSEPSGSSVEDLGQLEIAVPGSLDTPDPALLQLM